MAEIFQTDSDGNLVVLVPQQPAVQDFLVGTPLESNLTWTDLLEAFDHVMQGTVDTPIKQLTTIRKITRDTDEAILRQTCHMLGFDLSADYFKLSNNDILRIVSQLPLFAEHAMDVHWSRFLDFVLNAKTEVSYLWTQDYKTFHRKPLGSKLYEGGTWYKTSHVEFVVELRASPQLIEEVFGSSNSSLAKQLADIFYEYAPANLVVDRIILNETINADMDVSVGLAEQVHEYIEV